MRLTHASTPNPFLELYVTSPIFLKRSSKSGISLIHTQVCATRSRKKAAKISRSFGRGVMNVLLVDGLYVLFSTWTAKVIRSSSIHSRYRIHCSVVILWRQHSSNAMSHPSLISSLSAATALALYSLKRLLLFALPVPKLTYQALNWLFSRLDQKLPDCNALSVDITKPVGPV